MADSDDRGGLEAFAVALAEHVPARDDAPLACDLGWVVGRPERLVSHHVRALKAAGLARSERHGKMVIYAART